MIILGLVKKRICCQVKHLHLAHESAVQNFCLPPLRLGNSLRYKNTAIKK